MYGNGQGFGQPNMGINMQPTGYDAQGNPTGMNVQMGTSDPEYMEQPQDQSWSTPNAGDSQALNAGGSPRPLIDDQVINDQAGSAEEYIERVLQQLKNDNKGISSEQSATFLRNCSSDDSRKIVYSQIGPFLVGFSIDGLILLLKEISSDEFRAQTVEYLSIYLPNRPSEEDIGRAVDCVSNDMDKMVIRCALSATA